MRINLPVNGAEYVLQDGEKLVSTSDTTGRIIYANRRFIEVSGYSENELIGQPHSVIRDPNMPSVVFADLWQTVESGKPWSGLIKNRRKDGDFYWVAARVVPIEEDERTVGYMSVCTNPEHAPVTGTAELYGKISPAGALALRIGHSNTLTRSTQ